MVTVKDYKTKNQTTITQMMLNNNDNPLVLMDQMTRDQLNKVLTSQVYPTLDLVMNPYDALDEDEFADRLAMWRMKIFFPKIASRLATYVLERTDNELSVNKFMLTETNTGDTSDTSNVKGTSELKDSGTSNTTHKGYDTTEVTGTDKTDSSGSSKETLGQQEDVTHGHTVGTSGSDTTTITHGLKVANSGEDSTAHTGTDKTKLSHGLTISNTGNDSVQHEGSDTTIEGSTQSTTATDHNADGTGATHTSTVSTSPNGGGGTFTSKNTKSETDTTTHGLTTNNTGDDVTEVFHGATDTTSHGLTVTQSGNDVTTVGHGTTTTEGGTDTTKHSGDNTTTRSDSNTVTHDTQNKITYNSEQDVANTSQRTATNSSDTANAGHTTGQRVSVNWELWDRALESVGDIYDLCIRTLMEEGVLGVFY